MLQPVMRLAGEAYCTRIKVDANCLAWAFVESLYQPIECEPDSAYILCSQLYIKLWVYA